MFQNNQLARNRQIQAARQRLAARRGGVPAGAQNMNLAGCGGPRFNQGGWYPVQQGSPDAAWTPYSFFEGLPEMAPPGGGMLAGPGAIIRQYLAPCAAIVQAEAVGVATTFEMAPSGGAFFYGAGIKTCNEPFQVIINSLTTGSLEYDLIPCDGVDACYWNTDECYCPMDIGCFRNTSPLVVSFSAFGNPSVLPFLNFIVAGTRDSAFQDCGFGAGFPFYNGLLNNPYYGGYPGGYGGFGGPGPGPAFGPGPGAIAPNGMNSAM